ncbi:low molecular weight protein-tyrosine-phosphatase [Verrucomicrobiaceae bacterium 227]
MNPVCQVLFVCLGNICRSPAGENIFRHHLIQEQLSGPIRCDSAGTMGFHTGKKPDGRMSKTIKKRGYEVTGSARQFGLRDFEIFDFILTMDDENYANIIKLAKTDEQRSRVHKFTEFCTQHSHNEVPDPYYGGDEGFELVADLIEDGSKGLLAHIRKTRSI